MDEHDKDVVRHLHKHFGNRRFTTREASESTAKEGAAPGGLPSGEPEWAHTLEQLVARELVIAEVEGWRLILQAASIINI